MFEIIPNENPIVFENSNLTEVTKDIYRNAGMIRRCFYRIARDLVQVEKERLFVEDGFLSTIEYACKTFGFKKSLVYNLLTIGKQYTQPTGNESNLKHDKAKDFSSGQLSVMLSYDESKIREMTDADEITPYMTVREIKKRLKATEQEEQEDPGEPEEQEGGEEKPIFTIEGYRDDNGEWTVVSDGEVPLPLADAINTFIFD